MLCIYFSLSVQCMLTLLLQLKQTPTDSSYKQSFKKKRPTRNGETTVQTLWLFRGDRCSYEVEFLSCGSLGASPQLNNAVFSILVFVFHFFILFFLYPI